MYSYHNSVQFGKMFVEGWEKNLCLLYVWQMMHLYVNVVDVTCL